MKLFTDLRLLLLAIWLGAALFFVGVAQSAFAVLPSRELAGSVVSRTLMILNLSGLGIAVVLILMSLVGRTGANRFSLWGERFLLLVVGAACGVGQFVIALWMDFTRAQMGRPIDELAADDPLRLQFNSLHEYSVWVLIAGMAAALLAFILIAATRPANAGGNAATTNDPFDFSKPFVKK
ncbi:MAG TPA: DUF4149 domain-containing protein [Pyrinomonadaceae bacterium]|nr:DUF4149 domain-containing protein [Pyrinomonadaceae bacterium]